MDRRPVFSLDDKPLNADTLPARTDLIVEDGVPVHGDDACASRVRRPVTGDPLIARDDSPCGDTSKEAENAVAGAEADKTD